MELLFNVTVCCGKHTTCINYDTIYQKKKIYDTSSRYHGTQINAYSLFSHRFYYEFIVFRVLNNHSDIIWKIIQ